MKAILISAASLLLVHHSRAATYEWTAGGDGVSIFQEANWTLLAGSGAIPLIDPNVALAHDLVVNSGTPGGSGGFGGATSHLRMGGHSLTLNGGTTRGATGAGIQNDGTSGGAKSPLVISGGQLLVSFLSDISASLSGSAALTLSGSGNPLDSSSLELAAGWSGSVIFTAEPPANVRSEHLSKITVGGQAAMEGANVTLAATGGGCTLTTMAQTPTLPAPPARPDTDGDGLADIVETGGGIYQSASATGTSSSNPNSDGDRFRDGGEVVANTNPTSSASQPDFPNVVLILCDDLGWNHVGAYRQHSNRSYGTHYDPTLAPTPNIDALASQGMLFTDAHSGCTVCGPSRSSLQTGVHSGHIPYKDNYAYTELTPRLGTLGELFRRTGYVNGYIGKWGLAGTGSGHTPNDRGYHRFFGMLDHGHGHIHYPSYLIEDNVRVATGNTPRDSTGRTSLNAGDRVHHAHELFTQATLDFIDAHKDEAFFCTFSPTLPHTEIIATPSAAGPFLAKGWPEYNVGDNSSHYPQTAPRANFAGELKMIDDSVGAILKRLTLHGIADKTLVIFTSDNGGQLQSVWGSAPSTWFDANGVLRGGKQESYEGGLRVPMIVRWPGKTPAGTASTHPLYFADFMPTFCELLDQGPPSHTDGISFLPILENHPADQREHPFLYWAYRDQGTNQLDHAVRIGKWKGIKRGTNAIEVYDLNADIGETTNLAASQNALAVEMQRIITREYMPDLTDPRPSANSPVYPNHP